MNNYNQLDVNHFSGQNANNFMRQAGVVAVELTKTLIRFVQELLRLALGR
jgi:hypothetical protein